MESHSNLRHRICQNWFVLHDNLNATQKTILNSIITANIIVSATLISFFFFLVKIVNCLKKTKRKTFAISCQLGDLFKHVSSTYSNKVT